MIYCQTCGKNRHEAIALCLGTNDEVLKGVEGYSHLSSPAFLNLEGSYSCDEEDDPESRKSRSSSSSITRQLRTSLKEFYANLGDLTAPKRQQPGALAFKKQMGVVDMSARTKAMYNSIGAGPGEEQSGNQFEIVADSEQPVFSHMKSVIRHAIRNYTTAFLLAYACAGQASIFAVLSDNISPPSSSTVG